jgi:uncharacterized protein YprB with RNaseH-like and TPR domain
VCSPTEVASRAGTLDDLRRIIRRIEGARPPRPAPEPIEQVVGGEVVTTSEGPLLVVRREFSLGHAHGRYSLLDALAASPGVLGLMTRDGVSAADPRKLLFLDTETTGLAGGTGTYAFLVGAGYLAGDRFVVVQHFMRDFDEEAALLTELSPLLEQASAVVTYNGSGFDLPLLETRFLMGRRRWPVSLLHLDLLRPARRVWSARFDDCRLATLEREVLGLLRDDDVPGALIPALYFDFLRYRRAAPLARVFAHNEADVLSLVSLLGWFARALTADAPGVLDAWELAGLGRFIESTDPDRGARYFQAALAAGLEGLEALRIRLRLARWEKRCARWEAACTLWEAARGVDLFDVRPWEELAKYHEHRRRDYAAARAVVLEATDLARGAGAPGHVLHGLAHRLARLDRRLGPL